MTGSGSDSAAGPTRPVWFDDGPWEAPPSSPGESSADVCVVGAGIAGLTTAYLLSREGKRVLVVDKAGVGTGETGRSSAHLASAIDDRFRAMEKTHGTESTKRYYQRHAAAIDLIERIAREEDIDCDFTRVDGYLFAESGQDEYDLGRELEAAARLGVEGVTATSVVFQEGGLPRSCIRFPRQARFEPLKYVRGLARTLHARGVRFRFGDRVVSVSGDSPVTVRLSGGADITADAAVAATNVPGPIEGWTGIYTKVAPYRTYMVAFEVAPGSVTDALFWDMGSPYHYARLQGAGDREVLLVGGGYRKVGQPPEGGEASCFAGLEAWAREHFRGAGPVVGRWSGQVCEPVDGAAFIGRVPVKGHHACFVITGDSGMGLTHGTLGAMLVTDQIMQRANPWAGDYACDRRRARAVGAFLKENLNAALELRDHITPGDASGAAEISPGRGAVIRSGLKQLAVYRDADGSVHERSAICPHLGCVVHWNDAESSWDCPCQGSRFEPKGRVIIGPATDDLADG